MEHYDSLTAIPPRHRNAVIAIGNFDGVHRGHRALLEIVRREAGRLKTSTGVLTFEPHPRHLFRPDDPPFRLTPLPVKLRRLTESGLDFTCTLNFDWNFASQSAEQFIQTVLKDGIDPAMIVVGHDFRFGQLRKGTPEMLRAAGLAVLIIDPVTQPGGPAFSSSLIRESLWHADLDAANALLGWEWEIEGIIQRGDRRGRELGFPTANVPLSETLHPAYGVYAAMVQIEGEPLWRPSATNIGIRPMFELKVGQVEAHILDFDRDIYGKTLRIRPVKRLRGEAKFDSFDALIRQIEEDCRQARLALGNK